jgi:hypothetical protein
MTTTTVAGPAPGEAEATTTTTIAESAEPPPIRPRVELRVAAPTPGSQSGGDGGGDDGGGDGGPGLSPLDGLAATYSTGVEAIIGTSPAIVVLGALIGVLAVRGLDLESLRKEESGRKRGRRRRD